MKSTNLVNVTGNGTPEAIIEGTPAAFFYAHAGFSYDPMRQTADEGRAECAVILAEAEREASDRGFSFEWDTDGMTNREWTDEGEETPTWACVCRDESGSVVASLSGIDFGSGEPWGNPYRRVVEAELAQEAILP